MSLENLDEYISEFQNYQEGCYDYGTLTMEDDITKAIENGKKIVFLRNRRGDKINLIIGALLVLGIISTIFYVANLREIYDLTELLIGILCAPVLAFMVFDLFKMRTSFIVLGQEGIAYKLRGRRIQGFKWQDIFLEVNFIISIQIHILMPNGAFFKLTPGDYYSKEFPKLKSKFAFDLHRFTFTQYYHYRKLEPQEVKFKEDKQQVIEDLDSIERLKIVNYNSLKDLKKEYSKYKEKKYNFRKYGTGEQIENEFFKGKIFVLKGGLRSVDWMITIMLFITAFIPAIFLSIYDNGMGISVFCLWTFFQSIFLTKLRNFLIISPSGVCYRKFLSSGVFTWNQIINIKKNYRDYEGNVWVELEIYTSQGRKIKFKSSDYLNKEFLKKVEMEMFFTLFYVYSHQGKNLHFMDPKNDHKWIGFKRRYIQHESTLRNYSEYYRYNNIFALR